jgi:primosomal replication protein N
LNRLLLSARLVERGALRHTPAGVPALDLELRHESELSEDRQVRKVALQMHAVAIGAGITAAVAALPLGAEGGFAGFLAAARNGRGLVFHVTAVEPAPA